MSSSFGTIRIPGQPNIVADQENDTLDIVAGIGVTITANAVSDTIVISATQGPPGFAGSHGPVGFNGSQGTPGYQGSQGIIGYTGSRGYSGYAGSRGVQGQIGYSGSSAPAYGVIRVLDQENLVADQLKDVLDLVAGPGISITTDASIDTITISATGGGGGGGGFGYTGSRGLPGIPGANGYNGSVGFTGSAGFNGFTGSLGYTGSRGNTGVIGPIGYAGSVGFTGSRGLQGTLGYSGSQGDLGYSGSIGNLGYTGSVGIGFVIAKSYSTEAALIADTAPTGIVGGQFAIVETGNVEMPENSKLYLWSGTVYSYVTDLSGAAGITGPQGGTGYTGSASTQVGYTGSEGQIGYTGSMASNTALIVACSDETTALTSGVSKTTFRMPYAFTLNAVRASLTNAQTSGNILTIDINQNGSSVLSTKITIDNNEKTSVTAATAPVISTSSLVDDAEITVDIDQLGDGTAKGLKVTFIGSIV